MKNIFRLTLLKKVFQAKIRLVELTESQGKSRVEASQVLLDKQMNHGSIPMELLRRRISTTGHILKMS